MTNPEEPMPSDPSEPGSDNPRPSGPVDADELDTMQEQEDDLPGQPTP
jgi:hypothetical protein